MNAKRRSFRKVVRGEGKNYTNDVMLGSPYIDVDGVKNAKEREAP